MDIAALQMWSDKMRVGLGIIFILFVLCFIAIIVEETFLGGRRRRKAIAAARQRETASGLDEEQHPVRNS